MHPCWCPTPAPQGSKEDEIAPVAFRYYVEPSKRKVNISG
jgi:hypothetical protein